MPRAPTPEPSVAATGSASRVSSAGALPLQTPVNTRFIASVMTSIMDESAALAVRGTDCWRCWVARRERRTVPCLGSSRCPPLSSLLPRPGIVWRRGVARLRASRSGPRLGGDVINAQPSLQCNAQRPKRPKATQAAGQIAAGDSGGRTLGVSLPSHPSRCPSVCVSDCPARSCRACVALRVASL